MDGVQDSKALGNRINYEAKERPETPTNTNPFLFFLSFLVFPVFP